MMMKRTLFLACAALFVTSCGAQQAEIPPTATLAPIITMTPRFTATPIPTRTPLPTPTLTPSETPIPPTPSDTPSPTPTPPVLGSVLSLNDVNLREGPGINFPVLSALAPGTGFQILATDSGGGWFNVRLDGGREGWISATLVRVQPSPTLIPTLTPSPDLTLLAQGTPLPTSLFGGEPITPTPPRSVAEPEGEAVAAAPPETNETEGEPAQGVQLPNIEAIASTATALVNLGLPTQAPSDRPLGGPTGGPVAGVTPTPGPPQTAAPTPDGAVRVLAYCDDRSFGSPPPTNLTAGTPIIIFWSWYARTQEQLREHVDNVIYDVRLNGEPIPNWRQYAAPVRREGPNNDYYQYWFVPAGTVRAGENQITYTVSWRQAISDGYAQFGPGTATVTETGTCTFTAR